MPTLARLSGAGLGLRRELLAPLAQVQAGDIAFLEIAPENWIGRGGSTARSLRSFTERFPFVTHGLSLSKIEVFYLPSYRPELNPEERLNADLKHVIRSKVPVRTQATLHAATEAHMTDIASKPERVKAYFQDPRVQYAA